MSKYYPVILSIMLLIGWASIGNAAGENAEALFRRGSVLYSQGQIISSGIDFREVTSSYPTSPWAPAARVMLAKVYFTASEYDRAEETVADFETRYPGSSYIPWTKYFIAACRLRRGDAEGAATILSALAVSLPDDSLRTRTLVALRFRVAPILDSGRFAVLIAQQNLDPALLASVSQPSDSTGVASTDSQSPWERMPVYRIGLVVPLTGANADLGTYLLQGVKAVIDRHPQANGKPIELVVEDMGSDPVSAVLKTRKLIESDSVIAIIGPVLTETTVAAAVVAQEKNIPMIAPTTTNARLTDIGDMVFQINLNPEVQANALADLAMNALSFRTFAVITSNDAWGSDVVRSFTKTVEDRGGDVVWSGAFSDEGAAGNQSLLMAIREHAPGGKAVIDSMIVVEDGTAFPDTLFIKRDDSPRGERQLEPITGIDCIFISATAEHVVLLASQIMEFNIAATIIGDNGWWSNEEVIKGGEQSLIGSYVVAPVGERSGGQGLGYFSPQREVPESFRVPLLRGADAGLLIVQALQAGAGDPETLAQAIRSSHKVSAVGSELDIDSRTGENSGIRFVRVMAGGLQQVNWRPRLTTPRDTPPNSVPATSTTPPSGTTDGP